MDEKASNIHQQSFLAKAAEAHQKVSIMRPFCVLHAVLLGGCAGALLMGVSELSRTKSHCEDLHPKKTTYAYILPAPAVLHGQHGGDAQHRLW